jgi:chorismate dehydratase
MIRIALVSYMNTRPFLDGLNKHFGPDELALDLLPPAECATALASGRCAMALTPVGGLLDFQGLHLLNDYCIGAEGAVDSVFLFSQVPVTQTTHLVLDPHSRSSNGLARILYRELWGIDPVLVEPQGRAGSQVSGTTAAVLIGDQAYAERHNYPYVYDLAAEWKRLTGLPFVFAVWVYHPGRIKRDFLERITAALAWGIGQRDETARRWASHYGYTEEAAAHYLGHSIQYALDGVKHSALERYFNSLMALPSMEVVSAKSIS